MAILAGVAATPLLLATANAQTPPATDDVIIVTGTRVENRSALDTAVAVDVVGERSTRTGRRRRSQPGPRRLHLPSFNFPRPALNDGTDTVRPAALRGLAPDQTLVLVNSKRRHAASLVNVNGSIGRGSSAVDLNTIPTAAIRGIEVLRDGASAQYGSDAIAGVINVRLREAARAAASSASYGLREIGIHGPGDPADRRPADPVGPPSSRSAQDGQVLTLSGWKGLAALARTAS